MNAAADGSKVKATTTKRRIIEDGDSDDSDADSNMGAPPRDGSDDEESLAGMVTTRMCRLCSGCDVVLRVNHGCSSCGIAG